jgi:S-adenosylmethionine synthetase
MESKAAQSLYEEYKVIYEEKIAENCINQEKFFLNSLEVVHLAPFNDTSYEVLVYAIKEGKVIVFKIHDAIRLFGKLL